MTHIKVCCKNLNSSKAGLIILYLNDYLETFSFVFHIALLSDLIFLDPLALGVVGGDTSCLRTVLDWRHVGHITLRHVVFWTRVLVHCVMNNLLNFLILGLTHYILYFWQFSSIIFKIGEFKIYILRLVDFQFTDDNQNCVILIENCSLVSCIFRYPSVTFSYCWVFINICHIFTFDNRKILNNQKYDAQLGNIRLKICCTESFILILFTANNSYLQCKH